MDNSHRNFANDRDNFRLRGRKRLGRKLKPNKRKPFYDSVPKMQTVEDASGNEVLTQIKDTNGQIINIPQGNTPPEISTVQNEDGSESVRYINEVPEYAEDDSFTRSRLPRKKLKRVKVKKSPKSVGDGTLEFVYPLIKAMRIGLENKGVNTNRLTKQAIVEKFYNLYVSKQGDPQSTDEPLKEGWLENHYLFKADWDSFDSDNVGSLGDIQTVANVGKKVFSKIRGFLKKRKSAKKQKQDPKVVLPKSENQVAIEAEKAINEAKVQSDLGKTVTKEETKKDIVKYILYAVLAIAVILGLLKWFKK